MRRLVITLILISASYLVKAQIPQCLKGSYYVTNVLDTLDIIKKQSNDLNVYILKPRASNLLKDNSLHAMSLLKHIGPGYTPVRSDGKIYFVYKNQNIVTYDHKFVYFTSPIN